MNDASSSKTAIHLEAVSKHFGSTVAVDDVTLEVRTGEFFSLLGPSGCGKTTLLRVVGGFEAPDEGRVLVAGRDVTDATPQRRPTAMVFQNYALFPNMTVGENVAYGLRVRKVPKEERDRRVAETLKRVDLELLEARPVTQLSGGQQQRVALARAVAVEPEVLLFDEPLSNLDVALREQTRRELKVLQKRLGTTSLYVTHDQQEALALSDRIGVMRNGRLIQIGRPEELYEAPESAYVAEFLGGSNIIRDDALVRRLAGHPAPAGKVLAVRPESFRPSDDGLDATVVSRQFLGTLAEWWLEIDGVAIRAWLEPAVQAADRIRVAPTKTSWVRDDEDGTNEETSRSLS